MGGMGGHATFSCIDAEITHIRLGKPDEAEPCNRIIRIKYKKIVPSLLGGVIMQERVEKDDGDPIEEAIKLVENREVHFYVKGSDNTRIAVNVATSKNGRKYLRTAPNDTEDDNLLKLPHF